MPVYSKVEFLLAQLVRAVEDQGCERDKPYLLTSKYPFNANLMQDKHLSNVTNFSVIRY